MLHIDGTAGEGGGQILRTSLALSMHTGTPFRIARIRGRRTRPGLLRQHLTGVQAATQICGASVQGDVLKSQELTFSPGPVRAGHYAFDIGTAGSASLVLQAVLPALILADGPSTLEIRGGTHNKAAPPFDFLERCFLPLLARFGPRVSATLERHGFYPRGGGVVRFAITPVAALQPVSLLERGAVRAIRATALVAAPLPREIGKREIRVLGERLNATSGRTRVVDSPGPGNAVFAEVESEGLTEVFTGFGEKGVPAETVAHALATEVERYLQAEVPVDEHLADQLLLPMVLAGAGAFRTTTPSLHTRTNIAVIEQFTGRLVQAIQLGPDQWELRV